MWSENFLNQAPFVIAYEYNTLRDMLKKGELSEIIFQLKDAFEVALKFPVLIVLSDAFNIGHGAFTSTENKNFREDISNKIKILAEHFKHCEKIYENIKVLAKIKGNVSRSTDAPLQQI